MSPDVGEEGWVPLDDLLAHMRWQLNEAVSLLREVVRALARADAVLPCDALRNEIMDALPAMQKALTADPRAWT